jgi:hypothetical protein
MTNSSKAKIVILGYGEVGQAIQRFIPDATIEDINDPINYGADILHVCIPWQLHFIEIVKTHFAKLIIIHSSVPVGTTEQIPNAVHSPIRGVHPELYEGIKQHEKFIGTDEVDLGLLAQEHLTNIGMNVTLVDGSKTTELGKLLDTTYYGVCIDFHRYAKECCEAYGVDFHNAVTRMNQEYNSGYTKLGMEWVLRPVLTPPEGKIGGHCVIPNAHMLPPMQLTLWNQ